MRIHRARAAVGCLLVVACGQAKQDVSNAAGTAGHAAASSGGADASRAGSGGNASGGSGTSASGGMGSGLAGGTGSAGTTGGAGLPAAGAAGASGGAVGAGGATGGFGGGPEPDPVGLVATSGSYIVYELPIKDGAADGLVLRELDGSRSEIQVQIPGSYLGYRSLSPDRRSYVYSQGVVETGEGGAAAPVADDLCLIRFTDSGYVPGAIVDGFEGRPEYHYSAGFEASSRFAFFLRITPDRGLDIVDAARNARHHSLTVDATNMTLNVAPHGYLFSYTLDHHQDAQETYVAEVTEGGISEPELLPQGAGLLRYSEDGKRVFYVLTPATDTVSYGYVEPPAAPRSFHTRDGVFLDVAVHFLVEPGGDSVLAVLPDSVDSQSTVVQRLFTDETRAPVTVAGPYKNAELAGVSPGGTLAVYAYQLDADTGGNLAGIELVRGTEHFNILEPQATTVQGFFGGERFFYRLGQVLHAVTIESSAPVDTVVADGDYALDAGGCQPANLDTDKFYYSLPQFAGVRFVDLGLTGTGSARSVLPTDPLAYVGCPVCNAAGDACAYAEAKPDGSGSGSVSSVKVFMLRFGATGPSAPELLFETDHSINLKIFHP